MCHGWRACTSRARVWERNQDTILNVLDFQNIRPTMLNPFYNTEYEILKKIKSWIEADNPYTYFTTNPPWVNPKCSTTLHSCTINAPLAFAWRTIQALVAFAWCTNHFVHRVVFSYIGWNGVHPLCNPYNALAPAFVYVSHYIAIPINSMTSLTNGIAIQRTLQQARMNGIDIVLKSTDRRLNITYKG